MSQLTTFSPLDWSPRTENQYLGPWYFLLTSAESMGWGNEVLCVCQWLSCCLYTLPSGAGSGNASVPAPARLCQWVALERERERAGKEVVGGSCLLPLPLSVPQLHFLPGWQFQFLVLITLAEPPSSHQLRDQHQPSRIFSPKT